MQRPWELAVLVVAVTVGCASEGSDRAATLDCSGDECATDSRVVISAESGGASSTDGGAGGVAGEITLSGTLVVVDEPNFALSESTSTSDSFTLTTTASDQTTLEATATSTFSLDGVRVSESLWLTAAATTNSDFLTAVVGIDTTTYDSVYVPVVRESTLQLIASSLTSPLTLSDDQAQVVLRLLDEATEEPVADVAVWSSGASGVAYDDGSSYSDTTSGTGSRGLGMLFNVNATTTPTAVTVVLSGAVSTEFALWVQAGAATVVELLVSTS